MTRVCSLLNAAEFAKALKQCDECYCFMLNFAYDVTYGCDKVTEVNQYSEQMLDELEKEYPAVFNKPKYPIWEHR